MAVGTCAGGRPRSGSYLGQDCAGGRGPPATELDPLGGAVPASEMYVG